MSVPETLGDWDIDVVRKLVEDDAYEPSRFDFKSALKGTGSTQNRQELNRSIRKTACAMANSSGGLIIFGVKDRRDALGLHRIVGIPIGDDHRHHFSQKIEPIAPNVVFDALKSPIGLTENPEKCVFVVHIPKSSQAPHMDEDTGKFYRRSDGGSNEAMRWHEVHDQMFVTEERLANLQLLKFHVEAVTDRVEPLQVAWSNKELHLVRWDVETLRELIVACAVLLSRMPETFKCLEALLSHENAMNLALDASTRRQGEPCSVSQLKIHGDAIKVLAEQIFVELCAFLGAEPGQSLD